MTAAARKPSGPLKILEWLETHPGSTNTEIAKALGHDPNSTAARTTQLYQGGALSRELSPGLKKSFRYTVKDKNAPHQAPKPDVKKPGPVTVIRPPPAPKPEPPQPAVTPVTPQSTPLEMAMVGLVRSMSDAIFSQLQADLTTRLVGLMATVQLNMKDSPTPEELSTRLSSVLAVSAKPRLKSVFILGLMPTQAGQIVQEFGDCFDLRFWKDEGPDLLRSRAKSSDHTIICTSRMAHSDAELVEAHSPSWEKMFGGLTALRTRLTELYAET
jgi:hypothetical protein